MCCNVTRERDDNGVVLSPCCIFDSTRKGYQGEIWRGEVPINSLPINHDKVELIHRRESQFHHYGLPREPRNNIVKYRDATSEYDDETVAFDPCYIFDSTTKGSNEAKWYRVIYYRDTAEHYEIPRDPRYNIVICCTCDESRDTALWCVQCNKRTQCQ